MEEYVNINDFIKNYEDYKDATASEEANDLYYNDTIINYDII